MDFRGLLKHLRGASTLRKDRCEAIRDAPEEECGWEVTSLGKSVFFWTHQGFGYAYVGRFRDPNQTNVDKCILKENGNFETCGKITVMGLIAIRVDALLIS